MTESSGVVFGEHHGARSTSALGRAVVADALRQVDPVGARAAESETGWRHQYLAHFRRLVEAGLISGEAARRIAADGLDSLHDRMRVITGDGAEIGLREIFDGDLDPQQELCTVTVSGSGPIDQEVTLPYQGQRLRDDALKARLDAWVTTGVIEPSCAEAVKTVMANPAWLDLSDLKFTALGAGAEMGPVHSLLRWGADVIGIDLPRPQIWQRLLELTDRYAGRLHLPVPAHGHSTEVGDLAQNAGADLLHQLPSVAQWLLGHDGRLVIGNYVYADGATNVRVGAAVDALTEQVRRIRPDTALAFLATPTDVYAVPADAVAHAERDYRRPSLLRALRQPLRLLSAGKLLRRNYAPDMEPGICDSLVSQQGPNYALAKRVQRWRATVARRQGSTVSFKIAPPTRTRSVVKNRALAAAYAGAHNFGVEIFDPATSNTLMAVLLVHDLRDPLPPQPYVWQEEAHGAAHGGLWRLPYTPRSALGLAALVGLGGARG